MASRTSPFQAIMHRRSTTMERYLAGIIVLYVAIVSIRNPLFFSLETLFDLGRGSAVVMLLALGVLVVLVSGGIDVSFTAIAVVAGYSSVLFMMSIGVDNILVALLGAVVIGAALGVINALFIHVFKLPTLIVTLGTASLFYGVMAVLLGTKSYPTAEMPASLVAFGSLDLITIEGANSRYGLSVFVPIVIVAIIATWFILYRTMLGRSIYAVGSNEESASRIGVNIFATKVFVYSFSGLLAGIAGIMSFSEVKYVQPASIVGTELMVIAAAVIGGAKLTGGQGTVLGVVLGVTVMQLFQSTLVFLGLDSSWNNFFFGAVLLASLGLMYFRQRRADRRALVFAENA